MDVPELLAILVAVAAAALALRVELARSLRPIVEELRALREALGRDGAVGARLDPGRHAQEEVYIEPRAVPRPPATLRASLEEALRRLREEGPKRL